MTELDYKPGVCNIGAIGVKKRANFGLFFIGLSAIAFAALVALNADKLWRIALFFPLFAGFIGVFQAQKKFCAYNAKMKIYEKEQGRVEKAVRVVKKEFVDADSAAADKIISQSIAAAAVAASAMWLLP